MVESNTTDARLHKAKQLLKNTRLLVSELTARKKAEDARRRAEAKRLRAEMKLRHASGGARKPAPRSRAVPHPERELAALLQELDALSVYDRELLSESIGDEHILTHGNMRTGAAATHSLVGFSLARDAMHVKGTPRHAALLKALARGSPMVSSPSELVYTGYGHENGSHYYFKVTPAFLQSLKAAIRR